MAVHMIFGDVSMPLNSYGIYATDVIYIFGGEKYTTIHASFWMRACLTA